MPLKQLLNALAAAALILSASWALADPQAAPDTPLPGDEQVVQPITKSPHHSSHKVKNAANLSTASVDSKAAPATSQTKRSHGKKTSHGRHRASKATTGSHSKKHVKSHDKKSSAQSDKKTTASSKAKAGRKTKPHAAATTKDKVAHKPATKTKTDAKTKPGSKAKPDAKSAHSNKPTAGKAKKAAKPAAVKSKKPQKKASAKSAKAGKAAKKSGVGRKTAHHTKKSRHKK